MGPSDFGLFLTILDGEDGENDNNQGSGAGLPCGVNFYFEKGETKMRKIKEFYRPVKDRIVRAKKYGRHAQEFTVKRGDYPHFDRCKVGDTFAKKHTVANYKITAVKEISFKRDLFENYNPRPYYAELKEVCDLYYGNAHWVVYLYDEDKNPVGMYTRGDCVITFDDDDIVNDKEVSK